jgi:hypothetical protein
VRNQLPSTRALWALALLTDGPATVNTNFVETVVFSASNLVVKNVSKSAAMENEATQRKCCVCEKEIKAENVFCECELKICSRCHVCCGNVICELCLSNELYKALAKELL